MKIYKIYQTVNGDYDTYDSAVVCAENEEEAKKIHPSPYRKEEVGIETTAFDGWCSLKDVKVEEIGDANDDMKKGVIVASFNAG